MLDILFYLRSAANLCSLSADSDTLEMLKTISGDSVPVASLDALSQAEMATQYRKISQILEIENLKYANYEKR